MRYVVMSHDADARSVPASRAMNGNATTSIVEFSGTSAFPIAIEPMSCRAERLTREAYRGGCAIPAARQPRYFGDGLRRHRHRSRRAWERRRVSPREARAEGARP